MELGAHRPEVRLQLLKPSLQYPTAVTHTDWIRTKSDRKNARSRCRGLHKLQQTEESKRRDPNTGRNRCRGRHAAWFEGTYTWSASRRAAASGPGSLAPAASAPPPRFFRAAASALRSPGTPSQQTSLFFLIKKKKKTPLSIYLPTTRC